ncbi:glycoside hydrolase family 32 protein [Paenibacillus sp. 2TAB23]|uniref:glycoside hydrolase family 32 protein n=1 Tax=Paenibacillus sp. 2TAB23 TaxID=3233004 RepID=UPI003F9BCDDF
MGNFTVQQANDYIKRNEHLVHQDYRPGYHYAADIGWLNDPNGFSFFAGDYHLFYQYHPYQAAPGPMHWGHAKSKDLIQWDSLPVAIAPDAPYDRDGCFSGTAIEVDGQHVLMYTGHHNPDPEDPGKIRQTQCLAIGDGITYTKLDENPVIGSDALPAGALLQDFRDPKVWRKNGSYYSVIGSRYEDDSGQILLYRSSDLRSWQYVGVMSRSGNRFGKMWECPDLFELGDRDVLILSPQYLERDGERFCNVHSVTYMIGKLDYETGAYEYEYADELDYGFDYYAPQTLIDDKGRRIIIGWMQMWDRNIPAAQLGHQWAGMMTLPRVLSRRGNLLYQEPVKEIEDYRSHHVTFQSKLNGKRSLHEMEGKQLELKVAFKPLGASTFGLKVRKGKEEETVLSYDAEVGTFSFDRSRSGHVIQEAPTEGGINGVRTVSVGLEDGVLNLRIFLDLSSIEIFINDGVKTMSSTIYPSGDSNGIELFSDGEVEVTIDRWKLCHKENSKRMEEDIISHSVSF